MTMSLNQAAQLCKEAYRRLDHPSENAHGGSMQTGGAYWRLAKILRYLDARMDEDEGKEHADFIRRMHGVLTEHDTQKDSHETRS